MLKIKLTRTGKRNQPKYRIVVAEARSKRDGKHTDRIGFYDPLTEPETITIDMEAYTRWIGQGAQPTDTVASLISRYQDRADGTSTATKKKATSKKTSSKKKASK